MVQPEGSTALAQLCGTDTPLSRNKNKKSSVKMRGFPSPPPIRGSSGMALLFPGQGSQRLGMGRDLAESFSVAREVFEEVDEALGEFLSRLMFGEEGLDSAAQKRLTQTRNAQPAILAHSMAVLRALNQETGFMFLQTSKGLVTPCLGHSLGEYSALCAADYINLSDAAQITRRRGELMEESHPGEFAMLALMPLSVAQAELACEEARRSRPRGMGGSSSKGSSGRSARWVCEVANDNSPSQVVVSGTPDAVAAAAAVAKE